MGVKCIVLGCESEWYPACSVIFHKFPSDLVELNKWLAIVPLRKPVTDSSKICSLHFKPSDYDSSGKKLLAGVIPSYAEHDESGSDQEMSMASSSQHMVRRSKRKSISNVQEDTPPCKKSLLLERLTMPQMVIDNRVQVINRSTSPIYCGEDISIQTQLKTPREEALEKKNKVLAQRVTRLSRSLNRMKALMSEVKSYTNNSEIENIVNGNFAKLCELVRKDGQQSLQSIRYSDEVKTFALTLHLYSPEAYDFVRKYITLPCTETLRRCTTVIEYIET